MFPISNEALDLFQKGCRQTAEIIFYGTGQTFTITESDIMVNGLTVDRYCVSSSKIELGSACASELSLTLDNRDGKFNDVKFEGAELFVRVGISESDARAYGKSTPAPVALGYFTIDEPARALSTISLSALDRMVQFDKEVDWSLFMFPLTVKDMLTQVCTICNVPLGTDIGGRPNYDYLIQQLPNDDTTYRQIIQWIAELTATCAYIDYEGKLTLKWYESTSTKITASERYSSDMLENDIVISGVEVVDGESNIYINGNDSYAFKIENNNLIQHDYQEVCNAISNAVTGFTYRPYECVVKSMPHIFPTDMITYVDKDDIEHSTIVTNMTYKFNGSTTLLGQGETETNSGYASSNPLTSRETLIINTIKKALNETLNSNVQSVLAFNQLITNSLGIYPTQVQMPDGSTKYYLHDAETLEMSQTIYTMTAGGFAYTNDGWNGGNPTWIGGLSKNGNLIVKNVNAYGIEVSDPTSKNTSKITPGVFSVWYGAMQILTVNGDESIFTKVKSDQYECGRVRLLPHYEDGVLMGSNLVFID